MATGKICRLPREIREQLNQRLDDGEPGKRLVAWLNGLPAVRELLAAEFGGAAVNEQNLTNWKQGGFRECRMREEARALVRSAAGAAEVPVVTTGQLSTVLAARYTIAARNEQRTLKPANRRWRHWRVILRDVVTLQRRDQRDRRLALGGERREWRQKTKAQRVMAGMLREMQAWPEVVAAFREAFEKYELRKNQAEPGPIKVDQGEKFFSGAGKEGGGQ